MKQMMLLGDDAVAQGAIDAGISGGYAYPGTPSTEILEYIQRYDTDKNQLHTAWSANEKVAYEEALGMSYAGKRALICMKHVGLNVAADPFMNSAITGVKGGVLLAVADDPGMHSSQNEQDSRYFADMSGVPCLEPATQQEAYDWTHKGFDLSEELALPLMMRLVTRLSHSRSNINTGEKRDQNPLEPSSDRNQWVLLPSNARVQFDALLQKHDTLQKISEESGFNQVTHNPDAKIGIITSGVAYNYLMEYLGDRAGDYAIYKIGFYPLPLKSLNDFISRYPEIYIIEEGNPVIERKIREFSGRDKPIRGKLSGELPQSGEMNQDLVRHLFEPDHKTVPEVADLMANRPPQLCKGCPHRYSYDALNNIMAEHSQGRVFSDIGCYTLAALPPYEAIDTCVDMGASVSMANGAYHAGVSPAFAVIGDSTFAHSGITPLLDAAKGNFNIKLIILDNESVAMTGAQETMITQDKLVNVVKGVGVPEEHIIILEALPKFEEENTAALRKEVEYEGVSVIIFRRPCIYA